jgi:hypothetical protein
MQQDTRANLHDSLRRGDPSPIRASRAFTAPFSEAASPDRTRERIRRYSKRAASALDAKLIVADERNTALHPVSSAHANSSTANSRRT